MKSLPFLEDIYPPDLLYAVTIRSQIAKGYLKFIQVPILPEGYTFLTARDIPGENRLEGTNMPLLADKQLSYIGEPVAILLGKDKAKLEEISAKCVIITDEQTPVFSFTDITETQTQRKLETGDIQQSFEMDKKIVTGSYSTGIQDHWYAEPAGAICFFREEDPQNVSGKKKSGNHLVVRTATQWPNHVKRSCLLALGIDPSSLSVEPTALNLHMDGKLWYPSLLSCLAALGSLITKKNVRLVLTREEDFLYSPKRVQTNINIASSIDSNGKILASEIDVSVNLGAHEVNSHEILDHVCLGILGFYKIDNLKLTARANCTNIPVQGPFSGFGLAQGLFAIERHVSQIADTVRQDPALWRADYINPSFALPAMPSKFDVNGKELIEAACKMSDYNRKWASHDLLRQSRKGKSPQMGDNPRGIGIAAGYQGCGLLYNGEEKGAYNVEVTLTKESILEIKANITTSEDYNKIWEKVALETMSIKPGMVRIVSANTIDCGPSCLSRNITVVTKMVEKCCLAIRKQRFHAPLPITVRRSVKPQNGSLLGGLFTPPEGKLMDINAFSKLGTAAAVVEVSIDLIECVPVIRGIWMAIDGGKIISKNRARRSLSRGCTQALGWAFTENIEYINGSLPRTHYDDFNIFSPMEVPPTHIDFLSGDLNEPKGIGDLPSACIPAAFLQAVSQAVGHSFKSLPLKRNDIWEIIRLKKTEAQAAK
jgi:CO/xanthine dehydrogenase Mo-binding subunit